jgi:hypothetical protein
MTIARPACGALAFALLALVLPAQLVAQSTPFLTDRQIQLLSNEISGDRAYEHVRWLTHWHRDSGMEGYFKAAEYVMQAAREAGLTDVTFVEQPLEGPNYTARSAELWLVEPVEVKLADLGDRAVHLSDGSHDADVTAELVFVGDASAAALANVDVAGKIVLTTAQPGVALNNAVYGKGALGVITYATSESKNPLDFPDQIAWTRINVNVPEGKTPSFAFAISPRRGEMLRQLLATKAEQDIFATGRRTTGGRAVVHAKVDTDIGPAPGRTGFVEGWIRGSDTPDQQIVLTAHLQEEQGSANDDGSGSANLLEIARTLNKLIAEGKLPRPKRDIRFWWTDEIYSEYRYFRDHPEEAPRVLANIHQDMVGANQAMGSRVQHIIMAPHSRTSYLDAVYESIASYLVLTNNGFLSASRQGGYPRPFTRPIYSVRGSRQGYNARVVPWFGSSDHLVFLDGPIGRHAVATINWDDDWIHSSDDDLGNIDQTQMARNAFLTGATALVLAYADAGDVPLFARETYAQGSRRLAIDLQAAMTALSDTTRAAEARWADANLLIEQGIQREVRALQSVRDLGGSSRVVDDLVTRVRGREPELMGALRAARPGESANPAALERGAEVMAAKRKVPSNAGTIDEYFTNRGKVPGRPGMHGLMEAEVWNFVDGRRSYYDIYKAVRAEALAAGRWYYGDVTLADVTALLDGAVQAKALALK